MHTCGVLARRLCLASVTQCACAGWSLSSGVEFGKEIAKLQTEECGYEVRAAVNWLRWKCRTVVVMSAWDGEALYVCWWYAGARGAPRAGLPSRLQLS